MGCSKSAIHDDEDYYEHLCKEFGEPVSRDGPYGIHADHVKQLAAAIHDGKSETVKRYVVRFTAVFYESGTYSFRGDELYFEYGDVYVATMDTVFISRAAAIDAACENLRAKLDAFTPRH